AVTPDYPRARASSATNLAGAHGGERARLTNYDLDMLILEYQIFRETVLDVLDRHGVVLKQHELQTINRSIDLAIRDASAAFSLVLAELREQFIAALAHDMRTPLGSAGMAADLIALAGESERSVHLAGKIKDNLGRVDQMIHSLLDTMLFHHGERLSLKLSQFDLYPLVQETIEQANAGRGERCVLTGVPVTGWWDAEALRRALENLLGNAMKYGDKGAQVRIDLKCEHDRIALSVHNEGAPIPVEEQDAVFQIFRRANSAMQGKKQGWGVGLPYVRAVAESHGGSVVIDSAVGRGTTFIIDVPCDARPFLRAPASTL
ncbi:MAG TPA: HAMP domain-containing sensor histidine kinase, partial [Burkholderiaceae bacterium]